MNISRVEYMKTKKGPEQALVVVFTYNETISDAYEIVGDSDVDTVLDWLKMTPDPVQLLVALRQLMHITVH